MSGFTLPPSQLAALRFLRASALGALAPGSNVAGLVCQDFKGTEFGPGDLDALLHADLAEVSPLTAPISIGISPIDPEPGEICVTHLWQITPAGCLAIVIIEEQD